MTVGMKLSILLGFIIAYLIYLICRFSGWGALKLLLKEAAKATVQWFQCYLFMLLLPLGIVIKKWNFFKQAPRFDEEDRCYLLCYDNTLNMVALTALFTALGTIMVVLYNVLMWAISGEVK